MYYLIKNLHVTCVVLSAVGFLLRGTWMFHRQRPAAAPTDLGPAAFRRQHAAAIGDRAGGDDPAVPFSAGWVTAKVIGLLAYILLGTAALKRGRTSSGVRLAVRRRDPGVCVIVSVALSNVAGYLA